MSEQVGTIRKIMNGKTPIVLKVVFWIVGITASFVAAWQAMNVKVAEHGTHLLNHDVKIEKIECRVREVEDFATAQRTDNKWIKETLTRIENKLDD